jgi:hypothetical protein
VALHDLPPVLTLGQAALFLRLDHKAVLDAAHAGELPVIQLAPQLLIDTHRLLEELGVRVEKAMINSADAFEVAG